jgi:hypothetical protein
MAVRCDVPRNDTFDTKGARLIEIRTTNYEKQRVTSMLCATAGGRNHQLTPAYIKK